MTPLTESLYLYFCSSKT